MSAQPIVLFDGVCNLCNSSVQFILKRDKKKQFLFASLQSSAGQRLLQKFKLPLNQFNSFVLIEENRIYMKSSGALTMLKRLGGAWQLLYAFMIVPKFIRDGVYNLISKNRYKWFGKQESCWVPTPDLKARFLE